ncbi:hypothetical protein GJ496_002078 [Pomphorhynchus laevis]|nr:hypothetical protein GJ496_002078 [Pomphorhynchus laevis]
MNNFTFADLCCLFCFPPCPSSIAAKLAFLPPKPSYSLKPINNSGSLGCEQGTSRIYKIQINNTSSSCGCSSLTPELNKDACQVDECEQAEPFYVMTKRRNRIVCLYMKASVQNPKYTILYSHGNAVDLGQMCSFFSMLSACLNCNIFSYDYSGYGGSSGRPSEHNMYADADAAWNSLRNLYEVPAEKIIIYGQSIGSVPSIDLAARYKCAGVILHSPMVSGIRVACPGCTAIPTLCDVFQSTPKISKIKSYTLVIHGTNDEVINISHGITIFDRLKYPAEPLWVKGAGHNDIEMFDGFFERIRKFVFKECVEHSSNQNSESASNGAIF